MNKLLLFSVLLLSNALFSQAPYLQNQTYTYHQLQDVYADLGKKYPSTSKLIQFGESDYGENIQLFMISKTGSFSKESLQGKCILLINNAIHPGEPCGVDASVKLAQDLLSNPGNLSDELVIGIIPIYNVGGAHNRNCCSRANQNGPEEYGFRGNAKNLDLNRDFIKCDSKNTRVFYKIFHYLNPHVFVDTHTSNGADYQYIMTLITSQTDKMHPWIKDYTLNTLNPELFQEMANRKYDLVPYVHHISDTPDKGIVDYLETPRYSTGYTNLFNTISYVTEAHMLKPYQERVESTYAFLDILIQHMTANSKNLIDLKKRADYNTGHSEYFDLNWELDTTTFEMIEFKGYTAEYKKSEVTGLDRLHYNRDLPWVKEIKYFNRYTAIDSVTRPEYYIIPQAWTDVIIRLQLNDVKIYRLVENMSVEVEVYYIDNYETSTRPYEGHYLHHSTEVSKKTQTLEYAAGDYVIPTRNFNARFLVEVLEPHAPDSYFSWNYFDAILQQKEWFSAYVFEDKALAILNANPALKKEFEEKKSKDSEFAKSSFAQLYFIYQNSDNYERTHNKYPVTRFLNEFNSDEIELAPKLIGT